VTKGIANDDGYVQEDQWWDRPVLLVSKGIGYQTTSFKPSLESVSPEGVYISGNSLLN
jgi:hypothetical protein